MILYLFLYKVINKFLLYKPSCRKISSLLKVISGYALYDMLNINLISLNNWHAILLFFSSEIICFILKIIKFKN